MDLTELGTAAPVLTHRLLIKYTGYYDCECLCLDYVPPARLQRAAVFKHHSHFCEFAVDTIRSHVTNPVIKT
jgi:hypothetical protein